MHTGPKVKNVGRNAVNVDTNLKLGTLDGLNTYKD